MQIGSGTVLEVKLTATPVYWRVSAIDRQVVKLFDEDGSYRQMPYQHLMELLVSGRVNVVAAAK